MPKKARIIEGFVPEKSNQPRPTLDGAGDLIVKKKSKIYKDLSMSEPSTDITSDLNASLAELPGYDILSDDDLAGTSRTNKKALKKKSHKVEKKKRKPLRIFLIILTILIVLATAGFFALKYIWPEDTIGGNFWDIFSQKKLQEDENGRSNILLFGTEPEDYDGANLTDTILILSLNQTDKTAFMISLPRDLYVEHSNCPAFGTTSGRINEVYACIIESDSGTEETAAGALRSKAGSILGLDIQYFAHLNWAGFEQIIDAVGGVDVTIESSDPRGIYDVNTGLKLANGPVHLNGADALTLARARGSDGGYGLETSNFAREIHQQKIIQGVVSRIASGGVMSNPAKALELVNALGDNLITNFQASEVQALVDIARSVDTGSIISLPLLDYNNGIKLVTADTINGASVVVPTAGRFNYSEIQAYIKKSISADPVIREAAKIDVLKATNQPGLAQREADKLKTKNFTIGFIGNAPDGQYGAVEIYQISPNKTGTARALTDLFGVELKNVVPGGVDTNDVDFIIIIGQIPDGL